jgi:aspartyl-tRNA(Asn)/glutamyl-tRNA(Gln) amidotransferase subunit C
VPKLTREEVEHVARLARLSFSEDELAELTEQLGVILEHAAQVAALDTAGVPPTSHPVPNVNVLRPDDPIRGLDRAEVLAMAPQSEDGRFRVPRILDEP